MRSAILLLVLLVFGCAGPPQSAPERQATTSDAIPRLPDDLVGCYALYEQDGLPASRSLYFASDRIRLDSASWARPNTWRATRLGANGRVARDDREGRSVYWAADSLAADTIRIMIHTGFSGSELILGTRTLGPNTLHGRALEHWDLGPSTNEAGPVTAIRVACVTGAGWSRTWSWPRLQLSSPDRRLLR